MELKDRLKLYIDYTGTTVKQFERENGLSNGYINNMKSGMGVAKLELVLRNNPQLSRTWLLTGEGEMLSGGDAGSAASSPASSERETRPLLPYDAAAGVLSEMADGVTVDQCEARPVIHQFPAYAFTIIARGDSMLPRIESGDELACAPVPEAGFIEWGRVYVLDTSQGVVVKRIYEQGDALLCRSYNSEYPDFTIPKTDVRKVCRVVGIIRTNI